MYLRGTENALAIWDKIMDVGKSYGMIASVPNRIRRIEAGILDYSVDMDETVNPFEIGLSRLVHLDGPDFVGKTALIEARDKGLSRMLVGVSVSGEPLAYNEYPWNALSAEGHAIGHISSIVWSPRLQSNIGLAMLDISNCAIGDKLVVQTVDGNRDAVVVEKPFVDATKSKARA
ncbi:MAG: glycine cleavage T C-terminal barrel domain-containing protein [Alphaproteobacteria bacterium]|nr:glycine cleavage T C-terminal barrel domain-containing protein [Alphaproteobacteria bacterium]